MRNDDGVGQPRADAPAASGARRPYTKPTIREYGSIAKLTQSGGSTKPESGLPTKSGTCL
jgi:hypothetical protein